LNHRLFTLDCNNNRLKELPVLNESLEKLFCFNNHLTHLPRLNNHLTLFIFSKNPIYNIIFQNDNNLHHHRHYYNHVNAYHYDINFMNDNINSIFRIKQTLQTLYNFKFLFYCLKYKKKLRDFLWEKIRRPKIESKYHPSNLQKMMDGLSEDYDLTELLENW
jgi:hypothetical protein